MRIEQLLQTTRGLHGPETEELLKGIERVKWFLWHGNVMRADETLYDLLEEIDGVRKQDRQAGRPPSVVLKKLDRALGEFATYVDNNAGAIVNYGERYRCGERIATGFVESAVNQVISKRFVKKQQIRWTPRGAHLSSRFAPRSSMTSYARPSRGGIRGSELGTRCRSRRRRWSKDAALHTPRIVMLSD